MRAWRSARAEAGFSMLEVMIAGAILAVVMGIATYAVIEAQKLSSETASRQSCANSVQAALSLMRPELGQAISSRTTVATSPEVGGQANQLISFKKCVGFNTGTLTRTEEPAGVNDFIHYWYEPATAARSGRIKRKQGTTPAGSDLGNYTNFGAVRVVAADIDSNFRFTMNGTNAVTITIQATRTLSTSRVNRQTGVVDSFSVSVDGTSNVTLWN